MSSSTEPSHHYLTEPSDDMLCVICLEVAIEPMQHETCGKLLCKACHDKNGRNEKCPSCRSSDTKFYADLRSKLSA